MTPTRPLPDLVTPERLRALLLDPAADASAFVVPQAVDASASPAFRRAVGLAQFYASRSLADGTLESYARHWRAFLTWCALAGEDPLGGPDVVAAHLALLAEGTRDDTDELVLDERGQPVQRPLMTATIELRLAAINKAYDLIGMAPPGADPFVKRVRAGIRRQLGVHPLHRKDALTLPRLRTVLAVTHLPGPETVRDLVALQLWWHWRLPAGALARLRWEDLVVEGGRLVPVPGRIGTAGRRPAPLALGEDGPGSLGHLVGSLRAAAGGAGPVLPRVKAGQMEPRALSDAGVLKILRRLLAPVAGPGGDPLEVCAPRPEGMLELAAARHLEPQPIDVRDRALLLCGFAAAVRRSNLVAFRWRDFERHDEGLVVTLRRSKTDQEARGYQLFLPYGTHELTCPVRAWGAWRRHVTGVLGADPLQAVPDAPVFVGVDRHGNLHLDAGGRPVQLRDDSFNEVVRSRCGRAGLGGNYGAHSLRAGFVTTCVDEGVPLHEIAEQTNHRSIEALRVYIRRIQSAKRNPLRHLAL